MKKQERDNATITIRITKNDKEFLETYANSKGIGLGELMRNLALEKAEDEYDRAVFAKAERDFKEDPVVYTQKEVEKELGLTD